MFLLMIMAALLGLVTIYTIVTYNVLVCLLNLIRNAWSNIDTELKRRYDLIPNLVAAVRGYAAHEREVLEQVTSLRTRCMANNGSPAEQAVDEEQLVGALKQLVAVVEQYPALKADEHFLKLQKELINTENRIQAARRFFNGNVRDYLNKCGMFPSMLVARVFGFKPKEYFTVTSAVGEVPDVAFPG